MSEREKIQPISSKDILSALDGKVYASDFSLQEAVVGEFNKYLSHIPPGYSYLDLIAWAEFHGKLKEVEGKIKIDLREKPNNPGIEADPKIFTQAQRSSVISYPISRV